MYSALVMCLITFCMSKGAAADADGQQAALLLPMGSREKSKCMACVMQVEGRLAAQASGISNQEQSEVQSMSNGDEATVQASWPGVAKRPDSHELPSTLQYIAQQADINRDFQEEVKSQRQDKSEL